MAQGVIEQAIESALIRWGIGASVAGGVSAIFTNVDFWGIFVGLLGVSAAWWGAIRKDRREQAEHRMRMLEIAQNPERREAPR